MGKTLLVVPYYGRDYKNEKELKADWDQNKDFLVSDFLSRFDGKPVNKRDAIADGVDEIKARYGKLRKSTLFKCGSI
jgi:hypothetical protein